MPAALRLVLLAACLAGVGTAGWAQAVQAVQVDQQVERQPEKQPVKHAKKRTKKHKASHTPAHAHEPAHARTHVPAHLPVHAAAHKPAHKPAEAPAHASAHKPLHPAAHDVAHKLAHEPTHASSHAPAHEPVRNAALPASGVAALAAGEVSSQAMPKPAIKPAVAAADPTGDGFLNLYVELCVKRISEIDAFREKLLREKVLKLQPDSAKLFLAGMAGDAWPVPYQGKMGNFVLVLPEQKNLCMLYARRTDTSAVEQGFAEMVAKAPDPMIATRGPETHAVTRANGDSRTVSTTWAPPGSERKMQFILTTTSAPDAQTQAVGSVAIVVGPESAPGPDRAAGAPPARTPSGLPSPTARPHPQP